MTAETQRDLRASRLPDWLPAGTRNYLFHTERGISIRALARAVDCAPSTVLRQVRKIEGRRDDPLVDGALLALSARLARRGGAGEAGKGMQGGTAMGLTTQGTGGRMASLTQGQIDGAARDVLRALCERGAILAVAADMDSAVVVRPDGAGGQLRAAQASREIVQAMALKDWIASDAPQARVARYMITNEGRAALRRLVAKAENRAIGLGRAGDACDDGWDLHAIESAGRGGPPRLAGQESPLVGLSRRKDPDGSPFLSPALIDAARRLGEDYELGGLPFEGIEEVADLEAWLDAQTGALPRGIEEARARVREALTDLGPGLSEIALRCCCFLLGLEQTERDMGWSARSGKIVLRIALQRLERHYGERYGAHGPLIG